MTGDKLITGRSRKAIKSLSSLGNGLAVMPDSRELTAYLVNYTPFTERKKKATECLSRAGITNIVPINEWDREVLNDSLGNSLERWDTLAASIAHILYYNMLKRELREDFTPKSLEMHKKVLFNELRSVISARCMTPGEISVCLKHFCALSMIAIGNSSYGIIAEDDILPKPEGPTILKMVIEEACLLSADYIDLAGGCGLVPSLPEKHNMRNMGLTHLCELATPRTRTAACYMVSKELASSLVNQFLPLAMPIDWHLQALLIRESNLKACWTIDPVFVHGSEEGAYTSWREDVR